MAAVKRPNTHSLYWAAHQAVCPFQCVTDQVMGGCSTATLTPTHYRGSACVELNGNVRLDNQGGFIQAKISLGATVDMGQAHGLVLEVAGDIAKLNVHLRTADCQRPWESFRQTLSLSPDWQTVSLPFQGFRAHRHPFAFNPQSLHSIGLVVIDHCGPARVWIKRLALVGAPR